MPIRGSWSIFWSWSALWWWWSVAWWWSVGWSVMLRVVTMWPVWALRSEEALSLSWVAKGGAVPESNNENTKWGLNFFFTFCHFFIGFFSHLCIQQQWKRQMAFYFSSHFVILLLVVFSPVDPGACEHCIACTSWVDPVIQISLFSSYEFYMLYA